MADSKTLSIEHKEGPAPDWVLNDEYKIPGAQNSDSDSQELATLRTSLWQSGAYDLPQELADEANQIAAECVALLPFLERVASRWVDFERAAVRQYADVPQESDLGVPCTQNPDRRAADVAIHSVAEAIDYDRLCERAYALKEPAVEGHSAGGRDELTAEGLYVQLTEALHGLAEAYATAGGHIIAVRDALEAQPSAAQVVETERVRRSATAATAMLRSVSGDGVK